MAASALRDAVAEAEARAAKAAAERDEALQKLKVAASKSGRRRSMSSSSAAGDGDGSDALQRKLELKMAELAKMKAQLKAEKTSARKSLRDLAKQHQKATDEKNAADKRRADNIVASTRNALLKAAPLGPSCRMQHHCSQI